MYLIIILLIIIIGLLSILKFFKTRKKRYLIIGLILTFLIIGIPFYIFYYSPATIVGYAPPEMMR
ncbi:hypothetical protein COV53_02965 [Candidatus Gottesmanbacteria bacterium CG11_big_fil_rev_8_21_14_0_20_37_11]|uniref:Uncharacterized protein n=1 Tax=Candidatus Gottesmanbacteria bacterium CG11_big_fil_rev_8_21_14_0_20_37_11 TaxID=1974575 RepID=A0A2H0NJQ7_9BACT|nr:MAG: hypothetical protein COV53_02965 [Candidatus Gottesmanbacteria bacterium CG11_big_fil_rev_8_21_14_0_20_37_11]